MVPSPPVVAVDTVVRGLYGPVATRWYEPPSASSTHPGTVHPTLVWLHGGAFFAGGLDQPEADAFARALAVVGVRVVSVDYPLAPLLSTRWPMPPRSASGVARARFPAQVHDVGAVLAHIRSTHHPHPTLLLLGGASAGACLAAGAAAGLTAMNTAGNGAAEKHANGASPPDGVVLVYGFFHAHLPPRSRALRARLRGRRRFTHSRWPMLAMNLNYTASPTRLRDPSAFPGGHRLHGFPPTLLLDADRDGMRASSDQFAWDLMAEGTPVEHRVLHESVHGFLGRPEEPAFATGVDVIARWMSETAPAASWAVRHREVRRAGRWGVDGAGDPRPTR